MEKKIVLKNCNLINPLSIDDYIKHDGYRALTKAIKEMTPEEVISEIQKSGLRGRGGAGFPTGLKWSFAAKEAGDEKYVVCNADEGEPGTFKDREIMEKDPHTVIEAMIIAGFAIGSTKGYIYLRGEYHNIFPILEKAISQAKEKGYLGENILNLNIGFNFEIEIRSGVGAYICGEETALLDSIEGKRGQSRVKPPFPPSVGLWDKPTIINNVETLANIPSILNNGWQWFSKIGTEKSKGTKVFCVSGHVKKPGLFEVELGSITLKELIFKYAGGIENDKQIKAVLPGGAATCCLRSDEIDVKLDFESLDKAGSSLGSGAVIVMNEDTNMVEVAQNISHFFFHESCGMCTPCKEGTKHLNKMMVNFLKGSGKEKYYKLISRIADAMRLASRCGLGQAAPNPVTSIITKFKKEFDSKIIMVA